MTLNRKMMGECNKKVITFSVGNHTLFNLEKTQYLKSAYENLNSYNLNNLIEYLIQIGGKPLKLKLRRQFAFQVSWKKKESNIRARCHFQNIVDYLHFIKKDITIEKLRIVIADVTQYVKNIDPNENTDFILISTNSQASAIQFDSAERLFYNHQIRDQNQNNYSTDLLVIYAIRLSLENRVRELLGIDYATTKNGKNIGLSSLIKISKQLTTVSYSNDFDWEEVEWINDWLNHHMHRHIRPYPWTIHQSLEALKKFINPKDPIIRNNFKMYSFYAAAYVEDETIYHREINSKINEKHPGANIKWMPKKGIVIKK